MCIRDRPTTAAVLNVILNKYIPKYGHVKKNLSDQVKQFIMNKIVSYNKSNKNCSLVHNCAIVDVDLSLIHI